MHVLIHVRAYTFIMMARKNNALILIFCMCICRHQIKIMPPFKFLVYFSSLLPIFRVFTYTHSEFSVLFTLFSFLAYIPMSHCICGIVYVRLRFICVSSVSSQEKLNIWAVEICIFYSKQTEKKMLCTLCRVEENEKCGLECDGCGGGGEEVWKQALYVLKRTFSREVKNYV